MGTREDSDCMKIIQSTELDHVIHIMNPYSFPWFIADGWALDLALGKQTEAAVSICLTRSVL
jgi:hypothetical protein